MQQIFFKGRFCVEVKEDGGKERGQLMDGAPVNF